MTTPDREQALGGWQTIDGDEAIKFGDTVSYSIPGGGADPGYFGIGVVIGVHAKWPEVVCVATEKTWGMTINDGLCTKTGEATEDALRFRKRYEDAYPGFLAPLPPRTRQYQ